MSDLQEVLDDLKIDAKVISRKRGPSIERFEIEVGRGTKVNKVLGLDKHLSYHYGAPVSIGFIHGKRALGIDVPVKQSVVHLKDVMSPERDSIAIGDSVDGKITSKLNDLPHMIVAGATGSGKSVFINSLICDLLMKNTPDQLQLALIDPKQVELSRYEGLPHLRGKIINEPEQADRMLNGIVQEMTLRYRKMKEANVRHASELGLPKLVVIIDELADLMMVSGKSIETSIVRISQLARAASIHLIIATQRPSVDVLTGLIKANLPARLAFRTSSMTDSRVVLDEKGAEGLLGSGDCLFRSPGGGLARAQSAFVSDEEIDRLTNFWRKQLTPGTT